MHEIEISDRLRRIEREIDSVLEHVKALEALCLKGFRLVLQKENWLMSVLSDKIAELSVEVDAAAARVQGDVFNYKAKIAELEAKVAAGTATPEDLAALDAVKAKVKAIDPTDPTTL